MKFYKNVVRKYIRSDGFFTDFSMAFDKVPHFELIEKVALIRVGACLLEVLIYYLRNPSNVPTAL